MQDLFEPIELLEFELDAVAGGNPNNFTSVVLTAAGIGAVISSTITQAFALDSHAAATVAAAFNQSISVS
jgi:hypothetical protein